MSRNLIHINFYLHYHCTIETNMFIIPYALGILFLPVSQSFFFVSATSPKQLYRVLSNFAVIYRKQCVCRFAHHQEIPNSLFFGNFHTFTFRFWPYLEYRGEQFVSPTPHKPLHTISLNFTDI